MGNYSVSKVIDVGYVCLQLLLKEDKHASDTHINLISAHMLDDYCYDNHFGSRGEKLSKSYWTKYLVAKDRVNVVDMEAHFWH
jgi:hypothetical protein